MTAYWFFLSEISMELCALQKEPDIIPSTILNCWLNTYEAFAAVKKSWIQKSGKCCTYLCLYLMHDTGVLLQSLLKTLKTRQIVVRSGRWVCNWGIDSQYEPPGSYCQGVGKISEGVFFVVFCCGYEYTLDGGRTRSIEETNKWIQMWVLCRCYHKKYQWVQDIRHEVENLQSKCMDKDSEKVRNSCTDIYPTCANRIWKSGVDVVSFNVVLGEMDVERGMNTDTRVLTYVVRMGIMNQ